MNDSQVRETISPQRDVLVDEVRAIRAALVEQAGGDLDALAQRLRALHHEFANRTGQFADVPVEMQAEPFPHMNKPIVDPGIAELKPARRASTPGSPR